MTPTTKICSALFAVVLLCDVGSSTCCYNDHGPNDISTDYITCDGDKPYFTITTVNGDIVVQYPDGTNVPNCEPTTDTNVGAMTTVTTSTTSTDTSASTSPDTPTSSATSASKDASKSSGTSTTTTTPSTTASNGAWASAGPSLLGLLVAGAALVLQS